jgi:GntR family transcriptional regulator of arabinose operon
VVNSGTDESSGDAMTNRSAAKGRVGGVTPAEPRIPAYQRVKQALRETIARGDYSPDTPFVTERRVREEFGVSATTAVRALNELVTEGVLIRRQGKGTFVAERPASSASSRRSPGDQPPAVACILQGYGPHVSALLGGLENTCADLGYRLFLTHCNDNPERERTALREALESHASGIVIYPAEGNANVEAYEEVRHSGVPLVLVDRYRSDVATDAVLVDNLAVGFEVTKALIELGHRRIATLWDETECTSVRDRLTGHLQALRESGIPVRPELTVLRRYARREILEALFSSAEPPTVLLCANGYALAKVVADLVELGIDAPGRVELAGMDQAGPFDILPLTAVAAVLPSREMGVEAARLLHARISGAEPSGDVRHLVLPIGIRTRDSAPAHLRVVLGT